MLEGDLQFKQRPRYDQTIKVYCMVLADLLVSFEPPTKGF